MALNTATTADPAIAARLLERAAALVAEARPQDALPMLDRLGQLASPPPGARHLQARALLSLGRLSEAAAAADAALAETPTAVALLALRAQVRLAEGALEAALTDAADAVMAAPGDPAARGILGEALLETGRHAEAIYLLGQNFQADPQSPTALLGLARAFLLAGRHAAAEELLARAEALGLPRAGAMRAHNALLSGQPERALSLTTALLARGAVDASLHSIAAHAQVALGRLAEAAPHFAAAARLAPGNGYLAHLAAATGGENPAAPAAEYVAKLFDGYAEKFETELLGLGYRVPGLVRRAVERLFPAVAAGAAKLGPVLDLGCGTGLVGAALYDLLGGPLVGVDLSPRMLEQAAAKHIYAELRLRDLHAALAEDAGAYQLIIATDVFIYLGRIDAALALSRERLAPGGLLLFSVEQAPDAAQWVLGPAGRYAHSPAYLRETLAEAGLITVEMRPETLRLDRAQPVEGLFVIARAGGH